MPSFAVSTAPSAVRRQMRDTISTHFVHNHPAPKPAPQQQKPKYLSNICTKYHSTPASVVTCTLFQQNPVNAMNYHLNGHITQKTSEELLADLTAAARKAGQSTITYKQYQQAGTYYPTIFTRRFGTWNNALQQAGLQLTRQYRVTAANLLANLEHLWKTHNRQPTLRDLHPPHSRFGRKPYKRIFGSWRQALQTFIQKTPPSQQQDTTQLPAEKTRNRQPAHITWRLRHLTMKRDNFRCRQCGASTATDPQTQLHIDHIIPISKGGTSTPDNLQTLCATCNIGKSNL